MARTGRSFPNHNPVGTSQSGVGGGGSGVQAAKIVPPPPKRLRFGNTLRITKINDAVSKGDGQFSSLGSRSRIVFIGWRMDFVPTNPITVWHGQSGNTTYDNKLISATTQYFSLTEGGIFAPSPTVSTPLLITLEADEHMWFEWTRAGETGNASFVIRGITV